MIYLIIIVVLTIILVLSLRFRIIIQYIRLDGKELFDVELLFLGNVVKKNIPLSNLEKKDKKKKPKVKEKIIKDKKIGFDNLKNTLQNIYDYYYIFSKTLKKANKYYKKRLICEEFSFKISYGFGDAAITGIASGFTYGIIYNILLIIDNNMILNEPNIKINPDFNEMKLDVDFRSILSVRYVHIIIGCVIIVSYFIGAIFNKKLLPDKLNTNY